MLVAAGACTPRLQPVAPNGAFQPATRAQFAAAAARTVPGRHEIVRFSWRSEDTRLQLSGSGAARLAPPDSMRVDIAAMLGLGRSVLILTGDSAAARPAEAVEQILPDRFALWAALGVLRVPTGTLGVERMADGAREVWRVTDALGRTTLFDLRGDTLIGGSREEQGRTTMQLTLERGEDGQVRRALLLDLPRQRRLEIRIQGREASEPFPVDVWRLR
jgi:hypothetical protein